MKICPKCNTNKVKNSYLHCYNCNMKDDTASEPDNERETQREPIPNVLGMHYGSIFLKIKERVNVSAVLEKLFLLVIFTQVILKLM